MEIEKGNKLSFLDVEIIRKQGFFSVYNDDNQKKTYVKKLKNIQPPDTK